MSTVTERLRTFGGQVFRLDRSGTTWSARALHAAPLPIGQWIWDVHSLPGDANTIVVALSGFGLAQHVWRGAVPASASTVGQMAGSKAGVDRWKPPITAYNWSMPVSLRA